MNLSLVGVSHHQAPVELRERVAVDLEGARALAASLADGCEAVVLSTCNRTEIYLAADDDHALDRRAITALLELAGAEAASLEPVVYRLADESAALHLFRVAAGLDSLVPGEGEILGQVRDAFEVGRPGPLLDRLFRNALHAGRRARVETAIGESPASVPAAAAALAQQVFDDLDGRSVVLVGAGKMSELTARNLRSRGAAVSAVANRTAAHGEELARRLGARAIGLEGLAAELGAADVVVASTSAPGFVLAADELGAALRARRGRPILLVDLAVPRDVDPAPRFHRRVLRVRHRRPGGRRRGVPLRAPSRGGTGGAYRRRGGGALQGVAGIACGGAGDRVASRSRRGDPRSGARTCRRTARQAPGERASRGRGDHGADREQAAPPSDGAHEGSCRDFRRRDLC